MLSGDVERFCEINIFGIERILKMIVGCRNNFVECSVVIVVVIDFDYGVEIVGGNSIIDEVFGDLVCYKIFVSIE